MIPNLEDEKKQKMHFDQDEKYYYNQSFELVTEFLQAERINPDKASNNVFLSAFDYVGRSLFGGLDISKDPFILCAMVKAYISICQRYDMTPSMQGYANITQLSVDDVKQWAQDAKSINDKVFTIEMFLGVYHNILYDTISLSGFKNDYITINGIKYNRAEILTAVKGLVFNRLQFCREDAIKNKFLSSGQQLGAIALVNQEFRWDADKIQREEKARALTVADLPKITNYVNTPKLTESAETSEAL